MNALFAWSCAFLFGQAIEVPIYVLALRRVPRRHGDPLPRLLAIAFGATALTHPMVWWVFPRLCEGPYWLLGLLSESFAVAVEAVYLYGFGLRGPLRALLVSIAANGASCGLGLLSRERFGWP